MTLNPFSWLRSLIRLPSPEEVAETMKAEAYFDLRHAALMFEGCRQTRSLADVGPLNSALAGSDRTQLEIACEDLLTDPVLRACGNVVLREVLTDALAAVRGMSVLNLENEHESEAMLRMDRRLSASPSPGA